MILDNASVMVGGHDLSDHVKRVAISQEFVEIDVTTLLDTAKKTVLGLLGASFTVEFFQDFDLASELGWGDPYGETGWGGTDYNDVDASLSASFGPGSAVLVEVAPDGWAVSATNPIYSATCIMPAYRPIDGGVNEASKTSVTFLAQDAIQRATA